MPEFPYKKEDLCRGDWGSAGVRKGMGERNRSGAKTSAWAWNGGGRAYILRHNQFSTPELLAYRLANHHKFCGDPTGPCHVGNVDERPSPVRGDGDDFVGFTFFEVPGQFGVG